MNIKEIIERIIDKYLRDYFAAKAMQGLISAFADANSWPSDETKEPYEGVSEHAYDFADAMMEARK